MKMKVMAALLTAGSVTAGGAVWAATATGTLDVNATVLNECTVTTSAAQFGSIATESSADSTGGKITIKCGSNTAGDLNGNAIDSVKLTTQSTDFALSDGASATISYTLAGPAAAAIAYDTDFADLFSSATGGGIEVPVTASISDAGLVAGEFSQAVTVTVVYSAAAD